VAGFFGPMISPEWFLAEQIAGSPQQGITRNAQMVVYQLANIYLLMALVGIGVLYTTTESRVVRNYLIALAIGDLGHVGITYYVIEHEKAIDIANWTSVTWGNIGFTVGSIVLVAQSAGLLTWIHRRFSSSSVWPTCSVSLGKTVNRVL
jgi:hypothetical protein